MSSEYPSDETIREWTRRLVDALEREHPEQEHEPEGLRLPDQPEMRIHDPDGGRRRWRRKPGQASVAEAKDIINRVAAKHLLHPNDITAQRRSTVKVSAARKETYVALRRVGWSYPRIARLVGRDHTTIRYGVQTALGRQP